MRQTRRDETGEMPGSVRFRFRRSTEYDMTRQKKPTPGFPSRRRLESVCYEAFFFSFFFCSYSFNSLQLLPVCVLLRLNREIEPLQCSTDHSRPVTLPPWIPPPLAARAINHTYYVVRLPCQFTELAVHILEYTGVIAHSAVGFSTRGSWSSSSTLHTYYKPVRFARGRRRDGAPTGCATHDGDSPCG